MSDKKLQKSTKQEPQFISNSPCNEDLFEGKSHSKIANSIAPPKTRISVINITTRECCFVFNLVKPSEITINPIPPNTISIIIGKSIVILLAKE